MKALRDVDAIVKPETVLSGYSKLVAKKFAGAADRGKSGRPRIAKEKCLSWLVLLGEGGLPRAMREFVTHSTTGREPIRTRAICCSFLRRSHHRWSLDSFLTQLEVGWGFELSPHESVWLSLDYVYTRGREELGCDAPAPLLTRTIPARNHRSRICVQGGVLSPTPA